MNIYQFEKRGRSHIDLGIECQDYHKCTVSKDGSITICVVADGVGSCKFASTGAEIAVNTAFEFCKTNIPLENNVKDFEAVIRVSMIAAQRQVLLYAKGENEDPAEYCTTLMVVIGYGNTFYYGFSGDGGIIALKDGIFQNITTPQKGDDGESVITLMAGSEFWDFGSVSDVASLLIATDGVYDKLCDTRLCFDGAQKVYSNLCRALMDVYEFVDVENMYAEAFDDSCELLYENLSRCVRRDFSKESKEIIERIIKNNYPNKLLNGIFDDITLVVITTGESGGKSDIQSYKERELNEVLGEINQKLYPGLTFEIKKESKTKSETKCKTKCKTKFKKKRKNIRKPRNESEKSSVNDRI